MKVGYKTQTDNEYKSIKLPDDESSPIIVSVAQTKDNNMENKFLVWHIEGGLGKNIAATALIPAIAKKYRSRRLVIVASLARWSSSILSTLGQRSTALTRAGTAPQCFGAGEHRSRQYARCCL